MLYVSECIAIQRAGHADISTRAILMHILHVKTFPPNGKGEQKKQPIHFAVCEGRHKIDLWQTGI